MAPVTRSSQHGRPSALQAVMRSEEEPAVAGGEQPPEDLDMDSDDQLDKGNEISDEGEEPLQFEQDFYSRNAQQLLQPLQQTADRVSRQVEEFAKCLDIFNSARDDPADQTLWEESRALMENYHSTALSRKSRLSATSPRSRSSSRNRRSIGDSENESQKVQFEADLWVLAGEILVSDSPDAIQDAKLEQESGLEKLHHYSTNSEIWESFLNSDVIAQQYEAVLDWLQERASMSSPPLEEVIADLTIQSERGEGIWSAGPIYTKNAIKAQKRSRSWPKPLLPTNPGIRTSHVRATDRSPLVTQLDPDAQTRESAVLQTQDDFHEQAAWQACWEFLRRGHAQQDIQAWWSERKEVWRAVSIRGADSHTVAKEASPWMRIMNIATNPEWIDACKSLCRADADGYPYQAAVYALLCGETTASLRVCATIDDTLFTLFNSLLVKRYLEYVQAYKKKLSDFSSIAYQPGPSMLDHIRQYLVFSQTDERTRQESHQPLKAIEGALISKNFEPFFIQQGQAAAQVAHLTGQSAHLMEKDDTSPKNDVAQLTAEDPDSVRIVAHLQLLLKALGYLDKAYATNLYTMENNLASYIGWLQREGKFMLIPLYASKLSPSRIPHVLGAILIDITDAKERDTQIRLLKQYKLDLSEIVYAIFSLANFNEMVDFQEGAIPFTGAKITEHVGSGKVKTVKIRSGFMSEQLTGQEETAIRSVEWFRYIDVNSWGKACYAVSALYKIFLSEGRLPAARELATNVPLSQVSLAALGMNVRVTEAEVSDVQGMANDNEPSGPTRGPTSPKKKRQGQTQHLLQRPGVTRGILAAQSLVWEQLEMLVNAMTALEEWNYVADKLEENRTNAGQVRNLKKALRDHHNEVFACMEPLFETDFLCKPADKFEGAMLDQIRNFYLPECILAYNSVLYFAGHAISRAYLADCMNLAQQVATNETLTQAFVEAKRMREFVDAMAINAQAMVAASEVGKRGGSKKGSSRVDGSSGGKEGPVGLWNITWQGGEDADLEAVD